MFKCSICGHEVRSKRAMHGHMMTLHNEEYRKAGMKQEALSFQVEEQEEDQDNASSGKKKEKPAGLRHLNLTIPAEKLAFAEVSDYGDHYEYIDDNGFCYSTKEVKEKGWI